MSTTSWKIQDAFSVVVVNLTVQVWIQLFVWFLLLKFYVLAVFGEDLHLPCKASEQKNLRVCQQMFIICCFHSKDYWSERDRLLASKHHCPTVNIGDQIQLHDLQHIVFWGWCVWQSEFAEQHQCHLKKKKKAAEHTLLLSTFCW